MKDPVGRTTIRAVSRTAADRNTSRMARPALYGFLPSGLFPHSASAARAGGLLALKKRAT
jgi:hypothetical protein